MNSGATRNAASRSATFILAPKEEIPDSYLKVINHAMCVVVMMFISVKAVYAESEQEVFIGGASKTGKYTPAAEAICRFVNKRKDEHGIQCTAVVTKGSIYNINQVRDGVLTMGLAQSDWHFYAYNGTRKFSSRGAFKDLRSVFSVHPEVTTIVAAESSTVKTRAELKGKRLAISKWSTSMRDSARLFDAVGLKRNDFASVLEIKRSGDQFDLLCDGNVDAIVFTISHPAYVMKDRLIRNCLGVIIPVSGPEVDQLVGQYSYYRRAAISGGLYEMNPESIPTFGVGATLISSASVSPNTVYWVVKSVFESFDEFREREPVLHHLKKEEMIKDSLTAPLHRGAEQFYRESGLM